ncbi:glycosyltransferase [Nonomuraea candida]|uniref:glycosyltransferase n=1 Tax=Nonomuraea candida TaxID=359159 RepID=UPI000A7C236F|nr:glycosyltransferase [Nonomuraea candida]
MDASGGGGVPRVRGNDYRVLEPPEHFTPELRVSVIIPAYGGQDKLDLVLQGLARQTYPAGLTEIIVVDNGSSPPLRLPGGSAARLIVCDRPGRAAARNAGLAAATGDVIHWLDSDVVLTPGAVEAHMRWHHAAPYLSVTGYLRFTPAPLPAVLPEDLEAAFEPAEPHAWLAGMVERTDGLTANPVRPFSLHVGGATSVNAALVRAAGPMDEELVLGQDTERIRLITSILDPAEVTAEELARCSHDRWEAETGIDQLKTHLRGPGRILRSRTPEPACQEIWAYLLTHWALCTLICAAATTAGLDPDRIKFLGTVCIVRRSVTGPAAFSP